jgi:hypothetical protein
VPKVVTLTIDCPIFGITATSWQGTEAGIINNINRPGMALVPTWTSGTFHSGLDSLSGHFSCFISCKTIVNQQISYFAEKVISLCHFS